MQLHHRPFADTDSRLRLFVFCVLLGAYLLVYIPQPSSADGDAVLAAAAATLREGSPNINSMAYLDWLLPLPASRMGAFGVDGALYAKKGPTPSLALLPFVAAVDALPWLTTRATAMLLNPLITAATAALLYTLARRLGFRPRVAFITAMLYGLATFALVYTKTLFGEPLAALLLVFAVLCVERWRSGGAARNLVLAGAALGAMIGVNTVYAVLGAVVGVWVLWAIWRGGEGELPIRPYKLRGALAFGLPIVAWIVLLGIYNWARFGSPLSSGYHFAEGEGFTRPLLTGLYGLFLSPFRGLFWYNPILLLAIFGWLMLRRHAGGFAWLVLALVAANALSFAAWWSWHGGIVWGPRFLLPVTPLLALCLAPVIESAWVRARQSESNEDVGARRALFLRAMVIVLALVSLGVQALGALYSIYPYVNGYLNARFWTGEMDAAVTALQDVVLYDPLLSPIVGHAAMAWAGWSLEPAWAANGVDVAHVLAALAVMGVGLLALWRALPVRGVALVAAAVIVVSLNVVAAIQGDRGSAAAMRQLTESLEPHGTVVALTTLYESALVDLEGQRVMTMNAPTTPEDVWALRLWDYALGHGGRLWLVTWFGDGDPANWQARELWQTAAFAYARDVLGHRALLFDLSPVEADTAGGWMFGVVTLERYGVSAADDGVRVTLDWSSDSPADTPTQWFVHMLDAQGNIVAQQDRAPQGGYALTAEWSPGETVTDRLYFPLPPGTDTAGWQMRVGWVGANGEPVDVEGQDDPFVLLDVR